MVYFQKIEFQNISRELIEKRIRELSAKRHVSLDFVSSSTYIREEKYFLGQEDDKFIRIVRIRTPFGRLLPKIIVRFDKADFSFCKIRLSILSSLILLLLIVAIVLNIAYSIASGHCESDIASVIGVSLIYVLLIMVEAKLTKMRITAAKRGIVGA